MTILSQLKGYKELPTNVLSGLDHLPGLRAVRKARKFTIEDLSFMADVNQSVIQRAEGTFRNGTGISLRSAVAISDALAVPLNTLLGRAET